MPLYKHIFLKATRQTESFCCFAISPCSYNQHIRFHDMRYTVYNGICIYIYCIYTCICIYIYFFFKNHFKIYIHTTSTLLINCFILSLKITTTSAVVSPLAGARSWCSWNGFQTGQTPQSHQEPQEIRAPFSQRIPCMAIFTYILVDFYGKFFECKYDIYL